MRVISEKKLGSHVVELAGNGHTETVHRVVGEMHGLNPSGIFVHDFQPLARRMFHGHLVQRRRVAHLQGVKQFVGFYRHVPLDHGSGSWHVFVRIAPRGDVGLHCGDGHRPLSVHGRYRFNLTPCRFGMQ
jgi:hypothetical protein